MEDRVVTQDDSAEEQGRDGATGGRLRFSRRLSSAGVDPFSTVEWERRDAVIRGDDRIVLRYYTFFHFTSSLLAAPAHSLSILHEVRRGKEAVCNEAQTGRLSCSVRL